MVGIFEESFKSLKTFGF